MEKYVHKLEIVSGEGDYGSVEKYTGKRTIRAIKSRLTRERWNGQRWAHLLVDGQKVHDDNIEQWWLDRKE